MADIILPSDDEIERYGKWLKDNTPKFPEIGFREDGLPITREPKGLRNLEFDDSDRRGTSTGVKS